MLSVLASLTALDLSHRSGGGTFDLVSDSPEKFQRKGAKAPDEQ